MGLKYQTSKCFVLTKICIVICEYNLKLIFIHSVLYIFLYKIKKNYFCLRFFIKVMIINIIILAIKNYNLMAVFVNILSMS